MIADDLGATTPEVDALLEKLQIPGTRVLQFEFASNLKTSSIPHPVNSVVYTGTHDNDTTAGWYRKLPEAQRETLREKLRTDDRGVVWAMIREALASPAEINHRSRARLSGTGLWSPNEFSRSCERKLGMAAEGWRSDPGSRPTDAEPDYGVRAAGAR